MVHIKPKLELVYENRCMKAFFKKKSSYNSTVIASCTNMSSLTLNA